MAKKETTTARGRGVKTPGGALSVLGAGAAGGAGSGGGKRGGRGGGAREKTQVFGYSKSGFECVAYRSAGMLNRDGVNPVRGRTDGESELVERERSVALSREFYRNNELYAGLINRLVQAVVGRGYGLASLCPNREFAAALEAKWKEFGMAPEVRGVWNFRRLLRLIFRELLISGDVLVTKTKGGLLQVFESEQVVGPGASRLGIKLDASGLRPVQYFVAPYGLGRVENKKGMPVAARDALFISDPTRPSVLRGFPMMDPAFPMFHRVSDTLDSEAASWQLQSKFAVKVISRGTDEVMYQGSTAAGESGDLSRRVTELDNAIIFSGEEGDDIAGIERNTPGSSFPETVRTFVRLLGVLVGAPIELILLDFSEANFSVAKATLDQAHEGFRHWQDLMAEAFCTPVYTWQVGRWIASGELVLPEGVTLAQALAHKWNMPSFPWLDQYKQAMGEGLSVDRCFKSASAVCAAQGEDFEEVQAQREREVSRAIELAKGLEKRYGVAVPWQYFAAMDGGKGVFGGEDNHGGKGGEGEDGTTKGTKAHEGHKGGAE